MISRALSLVLACLLVLGMAPGVKAGAIAGQEMAAGGCAAPMAGDHVPDIDAALACHLICGAPLPDLIAAPVAPALRMALVRAMPVLPLTATVPEVATPPPRRV